MHLSVFSLDYLDKKNLPLAIRNTKIHCYLTGPAIAQSTPQRRVESNLMYEMRRSHIAQAILGYLRKHPDAQDTLSGIVEWWLPQEKIRTRTTTVKEVVAELVAKGLILQRKGKDSQVHYRINRRRLNEIKAVLLRKGGAH